MGRKVDARIIKLEAEIQGIRVVADADRETVWKLHKAIIHDFQKIRDVLTDVIEGN